jgi:hypothetical protein
VSGTSQDVTRMDLMCHEGLLYVQYSLGFFGLCSVFWVWGCCCVQMGVFVPRPVATLGLPPLCFVTREYVCVCLFAVAGSCLRSYCCHKSS